MTRILPFIHDPFIILVTANPIVPDYLSAQVKARRPRTFSVPVKVALNTRKPAMKRKRIVARRERLIVAVR